MDSTLRTLSGIHRKAEDSQVNTLIYSMGDRADDILRSFRLTEAESKVYKTVKEKFDSYFIKCYNTIFERARFNVRKQEPGESVDSFITALYELAEHCSYGELQDEMIRDRIVVGIKNPKLSEKLQMDDRLKPFSVFVNQKPLSNSNLYSGMCRVVDK